MRVVKQPIDQITFNFTSVLQSHLHSSLPQDKKIIHFKQLLQNPEINYYFNLSCWLQPCLSFWASKNSGSLIQHAMPVGLWVLCMMDTSKGSTKNSVSELLGEWEWKDFRIKKKYIFYYYERRRTEKLKRDEEKKDYLSYFSLYKWTKSPATNWTAGNRYHQTGSYSGYQRQELGCWITASIIPITGKSQSCPVKVSNGIQPFPNYCRPYFTSPNQATCGPVSRIFRLEKGQKEDLFLVYFIISLLNPCHTLSAIPKRLILLIPFPF